MIESPRIFRPEFPEERRVPRVVGIDDVAVAHRGLRVISCRELSSSLRRCIFVARQSIVDAQRKNAHAALLRRQAQGVVGLEALLPGVAHVRAACGAVVAYLRRRPPRAASV